MCACAWRCLANLAFGPARLQRCGGTAVANVARPGAFRNHGRCTELVVQNAACCTKFPTMSRGGFAAFPSHVFPAACGAAAVCASCRPSACPHSLRARCGGAVQGGELREQRGLPAAFAARSVALPRTSSAQLHTGKVSQLQVLMLYLRALGISVGWFGSLLGTLLGSVGARPLLEAHC